MTKTTPLDPRTCPIGRHPGIASDDAEILLDAMYDFIKTIPSTTPSLVLADRRALVERYRRFRGLIREKERHAG